MREVPLGVFLQEAPDPVPLQSGVAYETVGVLSYGRGLFRRPIVLGRDVSYSRYFRIRADQFVYSRLFAWEGALAVVPQELDGLFVSQEFPVFDIDKTVADPRYVALLTHWPQLTARIQGTETGMGGRRKRVHPPALLGVRAPLPDLSEQRRIVDLVGAFDHYLSRFETHARANSDARRATVWELFSDGEPARLGDILEFHYGEALPEGARTDDGPLVFGAAGPVGRHAHPTVPVGPVVVVGRKGVHAAASVPFGPRRDEDLQVLSGYRGQGGAGSIRWSDEACAVIDTAYWVRVKRPLDHRLLYWLLRHTDLTSLTTKTTLPGLSRSAIEDLRVRVPQSDRWHRLLACLDALDDEFVSSWRLAAATKRVRSHMLQALLSSHHTIPNSYDRLLDAAS